MQRFYVGPSEAIEVEYGAAFIEGYEAPFMIYETWAGEGVSVEGFNTIADAKAALAEVEDRSLIEWLD